MNIGVIEDTNIGFECHSFPVIIGVQIPSTMPEGLTVENTDYSSGHALIPCAARYINDFSNIISVGNYSELVVFITAPDVLDEVRDANFFLSGVSVDKYLIRIDCILITSITLCQAIPQLKQTTSTSSF